MYLQFHVPKSIFKSDHFPKKTSVNEVGATTESVSATKTTVTANTQNIRNYERSKDAAPSLETDMIVACCDIWTIFTMKSKMPINLHRV